MYAHLISAGQGLMEVRAHGTVYSLGPHAVYATTVASAQAHAQAAGLLPYVTRRVYPGGHSQGPSALRCHTQCSAVGAPWLAVSVHHIPKEAV